MTDLDLFEPKQGRLNYIGRVNVMPQLTKQEHEIVDVIRANPGISLSKLRQMFNIHPAYFADVITRIEKKGILFGEDDETIMIIKENGVFKK
jgi:DNA-binding MarR family transcriptional regulator